MPCMPAVLFDQIADDSAYRRMLAFEFQSRVRIQRPFLDDRLLDFPALGHRMVVALVKDLRIFVQIHNELLTPVGCELKEHLGALPGDEVGEFLILDQSKVLQQSAQAQLATGQLRGHLADVQPVGLVPESGAQPVEHPEQMLLLGTAHGRFPDRKVLHRVPLFQEV